MKHLSTFILLCSASIAQSNLAVSPIWKVDFTRVMFKVGSNEEDSFVSDLEFCWGNGDLIMLNSNYMSSREYQIQVTYPQSFLNNLMPLDFLTDDYADNRDTTRLFTPANNHMGFGWDISCVGDQVTGRTLFASTHLHVDNDQAYDPAVFVFKGSWSHWTATQQLTQSDEVPTNDGFGMSLMADKFHQHTVVVGCDSCASSSGVQYNGKLYVYDATTPAATSWSEVQILEVPYDFPADSTTRSSFYPSFTCSVNDEDTIERTCASDLFVCPGDDVCMSTNSGAGYVSNYVVDDQNGNQILSHNGIPSGQCFDIPLTVQCQVYSVRYTPTGSFGFPATGVFRATYTSPIDHPSWGLGTTVNIYDDVIVSGGWESRFKPSYFVFFRRPDGKWSFQQRIKWSSLGDEDASNYERDQISLFNDILVIGTPFEHVSVYDTYAYSSDQRSGNHPGGDDWAGRVHILKSISRFEASALDSEDSPGKPPPPPPNTLMFSHQQILESPIGAVGYGPVMFGYFGSAVAVDANTLLVVELGAQVDQNTNGVPNSIKPVVWIFKRQVGTSLWSAQQGLHSLTYDMVGQGTNLQYLNYYNVFSGDYYVGDEVLDTTIDAIRNNFIRPFVQLYGGTGAVIINAGNNARADLVVFNETSKWDCLVISVGDHFGDGWDTAVLEVETPDGRIDQFAPNCGLTYEKGWDDDDYTPQEFYSPVLEFLYCPTNAFDGGVYTLRIPEWEKSKFWWEIEWWVKLESELGEFYPGHLFRGKHDTEMKFSWDPKTKGFKPLPPPEMKRLIVNQTNCDLCVTEPPEELGYIYADDIRWITVTDTSVNAPGWFHKYKQLSTRYYVSDALGHKLFESKQFCKRDDGGSSTQCFLNIPDGTFLLRLGGALDTDHLNALDYSVSINGNSIKMSSQRQFVIADKAITVGAEFEVQPLCQAYDIVVHGLGTISLNGVDIQSILDLSANDISALEDAIASAFVGTNMAVSVHIISVINSIVSFNLAVTMHPHGVMDNMDATLSNVNNLGTKFLSISSSFLVGALSNGQVDRLSEVSSISVMSFTSLDARPTYTPPSSLIESIPQEAIVSKDMRGATVGQGLVFSYESAREVLVVFAACAIILFAVSRVYKTQRVIQYSQL